MKQYFLLTLCLLSLAATAQDMNVMSFNIRLNTKSDSLNAWPYRKDNVASQILYHQVHLLGVQEALNEQMEDLKARLPRYRSAGGGRDDGKTKGEYSAIFYDTLRLQAQQWGQFWLSETPDNPGAKGWDAAYPRMVTWVRFRDKLTKKTFVAFNTHFDHMGQVARRESAKMILQKAKEIAGNLPLIFTGDFNAAPSDEPIKIITDQHNPLHLTDAKGKAAFHYGPSGTFNGFRTAEVNDDPIDHIFLKGNWTVGSYAVLSETWRGRFASDHFAVLVALRLR
jgi:endonuclease/exonuclease/phosphatase family metal-dependent hydrolase